MGIAEKQRSPCKYAHTTQLYLTVFASFVRGGLNHFALGYCLLMSYVMASDQIQGALLSSTPLPAETQKMEALHDSSSKPCPGSKNIVKPRNDKLDYRIVELGNGLRATLVSDPQTDKAAAALDVRAGSLLDPPGIAGLAHFTEHMLFYSSEKYPTEDEYSKFISDHGGHTNAFTASEDTNYHFDVNWDHLAPALDRFAQFFVCPTISQSGVDREINAVDSEHGKNLNTDAWRQHQLNKHTANRNHPWCRFSTGNKDTLGTKPKSQGIDVRQAVVDFHDRFYSANLMKLAVYGRESLDNLEALVRGCFSEVPSHQLAVPEFPTDVFLPEHLGRLLKVVPQKDGHVVQLDWQVPSSFREYASTPSSYLSHLLGHEGNGSAFALLKKLGWATALVAGENQSSLSSTGFFFVRVELTSLGQENVREVVAIIFRYIHLLKSHGGVSEAIFNELAALQQLRFNFHDKQTPYDYTTNLAVAMQQYKDEDLLLGLYHVPQEFRPDLINRILDDLTPSRVRVYWASKQFEGQTCEVEPWYGTTFSNEPLPEDWLDCWSGAKEDPRLHLPEPNPFIPTDFTLYGTPGASSQPGEPQLLVSSPHTRMFHQLDVSFERPKVVVYLDFQCPEAYSSPDRAVMTRLYVKLIVDSLNELVYPAELAGLHYSVHNTMTGFQVVASGYNHKMATLLTTLVDKALRIKVDPERFAIMKEDLVKEYQNTRYQQPYQVALYHMNVLTNYKRWRIQEYQQVLPGITPEEVDEFVRAMMKRSFMEGLVIGNMPGEQVLALVESIEGQLLSTFNPRPLFPGEMKDLRALRLPAGQVSVWRERGPNLENENSALVATYQVGVDDLQRNALAQLLVHLWKREAFHQLRTVEQLGYIVALYHHQDLAVTYLSFVLQSNSFSANHMTDRVEVFVNRMCENMKDLPEEEFCKAVAELSKAKLEKPKKLAELAHKVWNEIYLGTLEFRRQEREVAALTSLTRSDLESFVQEVVGGPLSTRRLLVQVVGRAETSPTEAPAESIEGEESVAPDSSQANGHCQMTPQDGPPQVHINDFWAFKRSCEVLSAPHAVVNLPHTARTTSLRDVLPLNSDGKELPDSTETGPEAKL